MWIFTGPGKDDNQLLNLGNVTRILMEPVEGCEQCPNEHELSALTDVPTTPVAPYGVG